MSKTVGISPKVWVPALGQIVCGVIFIAIGLVVEGKTAIATGLATAVAGFAAPPAPVVTVGASRDPDEGSAAG